MPQMTPIRFMKPHNPFESQNPGIVEDAIQRDPKKSV
jgi:hypothetical protein